MAISWPSMKTDNACLLSRHWMGHRKTQRSRLCQLASVPLALGSVSSPTISVGGGTTLTIRGSGFQAGIKVAIGGKLTMATLVDMNTLTVVSPAVPTGPQQLTLTNATGETVSLDAAVTAN